MQKWFVRTNPTQYPDLFTYDVLEENPEPAKYQGIKEFGVASGLDSKENAHLIAAAPNMKEALKQVLALLDDVIYEHPADYTEEFVNQCKMENERVFDALAKAEGN